MLQYMYYCYLQTFTHILGKKSIKGFCICNCFILAFATYGLLYDFDYIYNFALLLY